MESRFSDLAINALFPRFCVSCKSEGALMCQNCLDHWAPVPPQVSCAFCGRGNSPRTCAECLDLVYLDGLTHFVPYGNVLFRELMTSWKYHGDRSVDAIFEKSLRRAVYRLEPLVRSYWVTHIPLHLSRVRQRGFDQAAIVADWVGNLFGLPVDTFVRRVRKTAPQARIGHDRRCVGEMDGVFSLIPGVCVPEYVLLCDDVFTSGTTMDAVARLLKENGVKIVWGFTLAKGK